LRFCFVIVSGVCRLASSCMRDFNFEADFMFPTACSPMLRAGTAMLVAWPVLYAYHTAPYVYHASVVSGHWGEIHRWSAGVGSEARVVKFTVVTLKIFRRNTRAIKMHNRLW
jgi:hypothetical protein